MALLFGLELVVISDCMEVSLLCTASKWKSFLSGPTVEVNGKPNVVIGDVCNCMSKDQESPGIAAGMEMTLVAVFFSNIFTKIKFLDNEAHVYIDVQILLF